MNLVLKNWELLTESENLRGCVHRSSRRTCSGFHGCSLAISMTMVDTVQPPFQKPIGVVATNKKMHLLKWNNANPIPIPGARHLSSVFYGERGWRSRKSPRRPVEGEIFFLTSPLIDQALSLTTHPSRLVSF